MIYNDQERAKLLLNYYEYREFKNTNHLTPAGGTKMAASAVPSSSLNFGKVIIASVLLLGAVAAIVWTIVWAAMNDARGSYAGSHYGSARTEAVRVMAIRYGGKLATQLRLGTPDVVNTHVKNNVLIGDDQVRIFHLIGPRGVKYCVPIWYDGSYSAEANAITRNCKF